MSDRPSEKGSGEPLMHDGGMPLMESLPPGYSSQPNYIQPAQPGIIPQGQPIQQGYVVQPPPPYGVQYNTPAPVTTVVPGRPAEDHMIPAILVTLFCFFPTGVLAIMRASDAKAAAAYGDMQSAEWHSQSAKKMIKISIIAGIITTVILVGLMIVYIAIISNVASKRLNDQYD